MRCESSIILLQSNACEYVVKVVDEYQRDAGEGIYDGSRDLGEFGNAGDEPEGGKGKSQPSVS